MPRIDPPGPEPATLLPTVSVVEETLRRARYSLALTLAAAAVLLGMLLAERQWSLDSARRAAERHASAERVASELRRIDGELTAAAHMATGTSRGHWIDRTAELAVALPQAADHLALLVPPEVAARHRAAGAEAEATLARMHASAVAALRSGAANSAAALFASPRYLELRQEFRSSTDALAQVALARTASEVSSRQQHSWWIGALALAGTLAVGLGLWKALTRGLARSRESLLAAEGRVQRLAASDLLTGLPNRAALHDAMLEAMRAARQEGRTLAVLMVDLDRFKPINDRHGHMVGDLVLKEVARRLDRCLRPQDLRSRYGGDEFVVAVTEPTGSAAALDTAEHVLRRLSEPMVLGDLTCSVGASIGVARYPLDGHTEDELMRKADSALYRAKLGGRSMVCEYDPRLDEVQSERNQIEQALRDGITRGELVPFYQPIVDLEERRVRSLELLCRWRHPVRGLLTPDKFIGVAEASGLIGPLTLALLRAACKDLAGFPAHWRLSLNVAPRQIEDETLVPALLAVLRETRTPPSRLDIELTETALVNDTARARRVILDLKRAGMTVTLDDFGTGYSSLAYLAEMTFDRIKIDRSFVRALRPGHAAESGQGPKIVDAIIGLSRSLGVENVAEGVEDEEQARALRALGCRFAQGWLFGRPLAAKDLKDRVVLARNHVALEEH